MTAGADMNLHLFLIFLHILAVTVWVGGMFFAHMCLRPAVGALEPSIRLSLMRSVLGCFFRWVMVAVVLILFTGLSMMLHVGFANAPKGWHMMMGSGIAMMLLFGHIYGAGYRRLDRAVAMTDWEAAAKALAGIRRLVGINLILGIFTIAFATLGNGF